MKIYGKGMWALFWFTDCICKIKKILQCFVRNFRKYVYNHCQFLGQIASKYIIYTDTMNNQTFADSTLMNHRHNFITKQTFWNQDILMIY